MKANRKIIAAEERAVSAVIGVILMVAITVAIAATVYTYVSGLISVKNNPTPRLTFVTNSIDNKMTVATADADIKWSDIVVTVHPACTGAGSGYTIYYNGGSIAATAFNATAPPAVPTGTTIAAGDYILLTSSTVNEEVRVSLRFGPTNSLLGIWTMVV